MASICGFGNIGIVMDAYRLFLAFFNKIHDFDEVCVGVILIKGINMEGYLVALAILIFVGYVLYWIFNNPYEYPYKEIRLDISRKRNVQWEDEIDRYLCKKNSITIFRDHDQYVQVWKKETEEKISKSLLKTWRKKQYLKIIDDERMFSFLLTRRQTRYSQRNYVKTPYIVNVKIGKVECSLREVEERYKLLSEIGFQCTLNEYHFKDQRNLMTKELKDRIKKRDNYTCQACGKYMPDEVGLHIDHIIPVSKGGKSIPSNLQVLCSKCNGSKSNKL